MSISRGCFERIGLSENKPVVLLLQKHKEYTNHYVLGVGYAVYRYSDESESQYIRIIDGLDLEFQPLRPLFGGISKRR